MVIPSIHCHPPLVHILVTLVEEGAVGNVRVPELEPDSSQGIKGGATGIVVVQATDDGSVHAEVGEAAGEVGYRIQNQDICGRDDEVVAGQPGEEVEEALEDGDDVVRRAVREVAVGVDGRDSGLGGGLEAGRGLERVAAAVVQEAEAFIGPFGRLPPKGDLAAVTGDQVRRNPPGPAVLLQMSGLNIPHPDDAVWSGVRDPGSARAGISGLHGLRLPSGPGLQRQDELRRLAGRAALAAHDEVDVAASDAGSVVVPDVLVGVDMQRGVLVFAEW